MLQVRDAVRDVFRTQLANARFHPRFQAAFLGWPNNRIAR
jgi:hypothetical protein